MVIPKDTIRSVRVHLNAAVYADVQDAATERKINVAEEIYRRILESSPGKRRVPVNDWVEPSWRTRYEGKYSIDVLRLRTEPEDFGPRIELWRAERDVSRTWLAAKLEVSVEVLRNWETARTMFPEDPKLQQDLLDTLDRLDRFYPELKDRIPPVKQKTAPPVVDDADNEFDKIEWLPGSTTY